MKNLSKFQAYEAARNLIRQVENGGQWSVRTAEAALPAGFILRGVDDSDFFPCTLANFERVFRAHAVQE